MAFFICLVFSADSAQAISDTGCGAPDVPYYVGSSDLLNEPYDVYIKLGKPGQQAAVDGYAYSLDETDPLCVTIGSVEASGDVWHKLGSYAPSNAKTTTMFQLSSIVFNNDPDANRPELMLVSQNEPVCVPQIECETTVEGQKAFIRPSGSLLNDNILNILHVVDPANDKLERVQYYAENELLYQTKNLENFDISLVPFFAQKLYRIMNYSSGQRIVIESKVPISHIDNFGSFLIRPFKKYEQIFIVLGIIISISLVLLMVRKVFVRFERYHSWKISHGFIHTGPTATLTSRTDRKAYIYQQVSKALRGIEQVGFVIGVSVGIALIAATYILQINTVDGQSMESTYSSGNKLVINKLPVTLARINHTAFVPQRGDVVIAYPNFGSSIMDNEINSEGTVVKRVIGLPGERIVLDSGVMTIYNNEHKDGFQPEANVPWAAHIQPDQTNIRIDITLESNEIFLCGDNRAASIDSRYNGPITTNQIVGVVLFHY